MAKRNRNRRTAEPATPTPVPTTPVVPVTTALKKAQEELVKFDEISLRCDVSRLADVVDKAFEFLDDYGYNFIHEKDVEDLHTNDYFRRMSGLKALNGAIRAHNAWVDSERAAQAEEERQRVLQDAKARAILERGRLTGAARPSWLDKPLPVGAR